MDKNIYFKSDNALILNGDCLDKNLIEENSIDLIVTSPPYNLGIKYDATDDEKDYEEYLDFTEKWLLNAFVWTKKDGRICIDIPLMTSKHGARNVYVDVVNICKKIGFKCKTSILWENTNISHRTKWGSWMSASSPHIACPIELILVLYKDVWKKTSGSKINDIERDEFISWTNGIWKLKSGNPKKIGHPAPFSNELPRRCLKLFSFVGDTVLDPFSGSGTTVIAAKQNNRNGIGIEISKDYCELSKNRILKECSDQLEFKI